MYTCSIQGSNHQIIILNNNLILRTLSEIYDAQIWQGHAMDTVGTWILHTKGEGSDTKRQETLPILKYPGIFIRHTQCP